MIWLSKYVNESIKDNATISFDDFKDEIENLNKKQYKQI